MMEDGVGEKKQPKNDYQNYFENRLEISLTFMRKIIWKAILGQEE